MDRLERAFDVALGLTVLSWAVLGIYQAPAADQLSIARLTISAVNFAAAVLFLTRAPAKAHGSTRALIESLPSVILGGVAIRIAPAPHTWPVVANVLFLFGGALAIASLATLGRSFSVLPALRDVVSRGPYRVVRHPAYVGELVLVIGAAFARYDWIGVAILVAAVVTVALRVLAEERLLTSDEAYRAYTSQVRYRLLPFVW